LTTQIGDTPEKLPGRSTPWATRMQSWGGSTWPDRPDLSPSRCKRRTARPRSSTAAGLNASADSATSSSTNDELLHRAANCGTPDRPFQLSRGTPARLQRRTRSEVTAIDPCSSTRSAAVVDERLGLEDLPQRGDASISKPGAWRRAKRLGFLGHPDRYLFRRREDHVRSARLLAGAGRLQDRRQRAGRSSRPRHLIYYATYEDEDEVQTRQGRRASSSSGPGPNRIGQGIESTTAACTRPMLCEGRLRGTVMVNCNPDDGLRTTTTPPDRLYFERSRVGGSRTSSRELGGGAVARPASSSARARRLLKLANRLPALARAGTSAGADRHGEDASVRHSLRQSRDPPTGRWTADR